MDAHHPLQAALAQVAQLRAERLAAPRLGQAVVAVKRFQAQRFAGTYADLLAGTDASQAAACFFLDELYSERDYAERDTQFQRIANTIDRLFPQRVSDTARLMAELHALTEGLDTCMGWAWQDPPAHLSDAQRYLLAWRQTGQAEARARQLQGVLQLGQELDQLTRTPGLRLLLKMMRKPAQAAGLQALQRFLEAGFDTFAALGRQPEGVAQFLGLIERRESDWVHTLFDADLVACVTKLEQTLGLAR